MNESTTRPDCPVGPDESPTLVTWCDGCGAAGLSRAADGNTQRHRTNPAARKGRVHDANALRAGLDAGVRRGG